MRSERREDVWAITDGRCFYCGEMLIPDDTISTGNKHAMQIDHMTPMWRGGSNKIENLVPCCGDCNPAKGVMTVDEFRLWQMLMFGRPPVPFFGELSRQQHERDWLILYGDDHEIIRELPARPKKKSIPRRVARYLGSEIVE